MNKFVVKKPFEDAQLVLNVPSVPPLQYDPTEFDRPLSDWMRLQVEGWLEVVRRPFLAPMVIVVNEEGIPLGKHHNIILKDNTCLYGTIIFCREEYGDFKTLRDEDIALLKKWGILENVD